MIYNSYKVHHTIQFKEATDQTIICQQYNSRWKYIKNKLIYNDIFFFVMVFCKLLNYYSCIPNYSKKQMEKINWEIKIRSIC